MLFSANESLGRHQRENFGLTLSYWSSQSSIRIKLGKEVVLWKATRVVGTFFLIVLLAGVLLSTLSYFSSSYWRWQTPPEGSKQEYTYDQTSPAYNQPEESESKPPWVIDQPAPPSAPVKSCYGVGETVEANGLSFTLRNASVSQYNEKDLVVLEFFIEDISNEHEHIYWASFDAFVDDWAVDEESPIFVPGLSIDQF